MEANEGTGSGAGPTSAAPLTEVIAAQVKRFRKAANLSGAALAARLVTLGVKWNRTTVAKFETGHRASISVQELLALALALNVAPALLMADPRTGHSVPVATDQLLDPWDALMWIAGAGIGHEPRLVEAAVRVEEAVIELQDPGSSFDLHRAASRSESEPTAGALETLRRYDDDRHRQALLSLRIGLAAMQRAGAEIPSIIDRAAVLRRAEELGVADEYNLNAILRDGHQVS